MPASENGLQKPFSVPLEGAVSQQRPSSDNSDTERFTGGVRSFSNDYESVISPEEEEEEVGRPSPR